MTALPSTPRGSDAAASSTAASSSESREGLPIGVVGEPSDGTIVVVGHPANGHTARRRNGWWLSNRDDRVLDLDPRDVTSVLFDPMRAGGQR